MPKMLKALFKNELYFIIIISFILRWWYTYMINSLFWLLDNRTVISTDEK